MGAVAHFTIFVSHLHYLWKEMKGPQRANLTGQSHQRRTRGAKRPVASLISLPLLALSGRTPLLSWPQPADPKTQSRLKTRTGVIVVSLVWGPLGATVRDCEPIELGTRVSSRLLNWHKRQVQIEVHPFKLDTGMVIVKSSRVHLNNFRERLY